ncbi:MAG: pyrimidine 5'-nucleotidase [Bacteroidota bacterium]
MSYQYLIFDLDNTLYPRESGLLNQVDRRIDQFIGLKLKIPTIKIPQLRREYWKRYGTTLGGMVACHRIDPDEYINYTYNVKITEFLKPDPLLAKILAGLNMKKVVFSNSPLNYVEDVLKVLQIRDFFVKIYDIRFCDYLGKPNLSSYFKVLADLKVEGKECLFIDDTPANVVGGEAAGIGSVLLGNNSVEGVKWRISDLMELPELIMKIEGQLTA